MVCLASPAWWTQSLCRSMIQWLALMWAWNRSPSPVMGKSRDNPRCYRRAQRQLRRKQRHVSRGTKCFSGWRKAGRLTAKLHRHVFHQRHDFQHKLSRELVNHYGRIAVEDFNVQGLAGGMLAKSVHDAAWSSFIRKLLDKAESADRVLGESRPERNRATMPWWKACSEETLESAPSVFAWSKHNPRPRLSIGNSTARTAPKNRNACHNGRGS